jgi:curved DNA-binding protein CbpA
VPSAIDPYETLQVSHAAQPEVIRAAFRTLARMNHPDVGGSAETMTALNEAWAMLRDRRRRARYDRELATAEAVRTGGAGPAPQPPLRTQPSSGTVVDFGRYEGRTLAELAVSDPGYLEWLVRTRIGSRFRPEVDRLFASRVATAPPPPLARRRSFFGRG